MRASILLLAGLVAGCDEDEAAKETGLDDHDQDNDGYTVEDGDCDDADYTVNPGENEIFYDGVDQDCDGVDDDQDGDGVGVTEDCDDADAAINPSATEVCDGVDNDCDGVTDPDALAVYADVDGDGYGDDATLTTACTLEAGYSETGGDCLDTDATVSPAGVETCNTLDDDCDGATDEDATDAQSLYVDGDGDGDGDPAQAVTGCAGDGYAPTGGDCDDTDASVSSLATESCDEIDNDCDGLTDEDVAGVYYADADADGYGDPAATVEACEAPEGYGADGTDCDDTNPAAYPGNAEVCDEVDNDCDDVVDEGVSTTWYADSDGDSFGDPDATVDACTLPSGYVADATDCDDTDAGAYVGATEYCDGNDDDCDGLTDEDDAADVGTFYEDADGDGYGNSASTDTACAAAAGFVDNADDCDDGESSVHPAAPETCNETDDDCDGDTDEDATDMTDWYTDADGDGYGVDGSATAACDMPTGTAAVAGDCDDGDDGAYPGAPEADDLTDNDCDGYADEDFLLAGDVVITEVARQPYVGGTSTNSDAQWFEVANVSGRDLVLDNWTVQRTSAGEGTDSWAIDPDDGVVFSDGELLVFCKTDNYTGDATTNSLLACDYYWGDEAEDATFSDAWHDNTFNLQRDEDALAIFGGGDATTGVLLDVVSWTYDATSGFWPRDGGRSMSLDPASTDASANDDLDNWCSTPATDAYLWYDDGVSTEPDYGTPGDDNPGC